MSNGPLHRERQAGWFACALVAALLLPLAALAQVDPVLADLQAGLDDGADVRDWRSFGDVSLSTDQVNGLPNRKLERVRGRLRLGLSGSAGEAWSYALSIKAGAGTDPNADNRINNDNEASNGIALDQAWLRWQSDGGTALQLGQGEFPLRTTPLTWDRDLRPIGASIEHTWALGDFDELRLVGGHFAGNLLYHDRSRINAVQLGWRWRPGAPFSADVQLGYLDFDRLNRAVQEGLTRTNRRVGGRLLSDYRLLDVQLGLRWELDHGPLALRANLLKNFGADDANRGGRLSLIHGNADLLTGPEFAVSWQRIGRDAAMAAFNSDDWWFHSAARGVMPWVAYGWRSGWTVQASLFHERRDDVDSYLNRFLVELRSRF